MFSLRWFRSTYEGEAEPIRDASRSGLRFAVFTSRTDGGDLRLALPPEVWTHGGHHTTFSPDGTRLTMNLAGLAGRGPPEGGAAFRVG